MTLGGLTYKMLRIAAALVAVAAVAVVELAPELAIVAR